jgi:predicted  nucleic acid-binding Zn-ribbon protein
MLNLQAVLKYQETDKKLFAIERELSASPERKEYSKTKKFLMAASERLDSLDAKAKQCMAQASELVKSYQGAEEQLAEFSHVDELLESGADISFYKKNATALMDKLKKIKSALSALIKEIEATDEEFNKLKKQVVSMQKQYAVAGEQYNALKASKEDEVKAIKQELKKLASDIKDDFLTKYEAKRKEKIFPVVGKLTDGRCPFCSMELSLAAADKLKGGGVSECDDCHRILYGE